MSRPESVSGLFIMAKSLWNAAVDAQSDGCKYSGRPDCQSVAGDGSPGVFPWAAGDRAGTTEPQFSASRMSEAENGADLWLEHLT